MPDSLRTRDRIIYGIVLPVGVMIVGLLLIMSVESSAAAAEFAALGIMLGAIIAAPIMLAITTFLAFQPVTTPAACFVRGMIAPGIVLVGAVAYQAGLWDAVSG